MIIQRLVLLTLLLTLKATLVFSLNIIPKPLQVKESEGTFTFSKNLAIAAPEAFYHEAEVMAEMFETVSNFKLVIQQKSARADIVFIHDDKLEEKLGKEGYILCLIFLR